MVGVAALQPFLEARSAVAGRAFARPRAEAGLELSQGLSDALDACLGELAEPVAGQGAAVVALGSYGRRELCRHSDVDLMLLFAGNPDQDVVNRMLYPLWDSGLQVGHSTRGLQQVIPAARENIQTCTSLLNARLVAGDEALFGRFQNELRNFVRRRRSWLHEELAAGRDARVRGEPWQPQEPDLKTGRGGLRSLQTVQWMELSQALADDREEAWLTPELAEARELLLATRNALHAIDDRPNDRLRRDLVDRVAESLGSNRRELSRSVTEAMRFVDAAAAESLRTDAPSGTGGRWRQLVPWGRRHAEGGEETPAARAVGSDLDRLIAVLDGMDPGGPLDPLPHSEWLERVLPEWSPLRYEPHVTLFHTHPVDVHICRTVVEAKLAMETDDFNAGTPEAAAAIGDKREVLLAALLHDIGKGHGGQHSGRGALMAERFAERAGLGDEVAQRLHDVVQHHLLLPDVATRRDISDERVIREVAETVGDMRTLNLLYVLSVADARACGSDVWNAWKAQLLRSLYVRVSEELSGVSQRTPAVRRDAALRALSDRVEPQAVEAHLDQMPIGYLLSMEPEAIGRHIELIDNGVTSRAAADEPIAPVLHHDQLGNLDRITIVTGDRPGILQAVAGSLAVHNVNVLGGTAYTRDDGVAIDVMHVGDGRGRDIDGQRWERIFDSMSSALVGEFPIESRLAAARASYGAEPAARLPTTVDVDNASSDEYSIVEVHAADRLGLLYTITTALRDMSLDIHMAKVNTFGDEIVDAFYVRRQNGLRIEAGDEIERLVARVTAAVAALDAGGPVRAS